MRISYAIPVCNEHKEIKRLTEFLLAHKNEQDEIVILIDQHNFTPEVRDYVETFAEECADQNVSRAYYPLNKDFASFKNYLTTLCSGDYIYQIDADEMVNEYVCRILPQMLAMNQVDVIRVPRINTVEGLTTEHIHRWGWSVNEHGWVNFPDYQWRIYRNTKEIKWENRVHEMLTGYKTMSHLPTEMEWCLIHDKTIDRQEQQNEFYDTL
jgi:hypothetical protein